MQDEVEIPCPWCGQPFVAMADATGGDQAWTIDCEVCCRPIQVRIRTEDGEILGLEADPG